jgi:hypothetical protein
LFAPCDEARTVPAVDDSIGQWLHFVVGL